jgi:tyrosine-specific transport protein
LEEQLKVGKGNIISAMFLVGGTCIGGGMLALPVATGISGFFPSAFIMALCWAAMTASALFLLEANLWMNKEGAHIITMSEVILGPFARILSWCLYLFISYASLIAYTAAGGLLIVNGVENLFGMHLSEEVSCFIFIVLFGGVIYLGNQIVGRVNTILFIAMIASYFALIGTGMQEVKTQMLVHRKWITAFFAVPLLLTAFSFQTMLPSLTPYLKRNVTALRWAIVGGTTIAFIVYLIWQALVLGIVPVHGPNSLIEALLAGEPITHFLREHVQSEWVSSIAEYFAFFALITSFLGMALGLFDFLSDGLKIKKAGMGKILLGLLMVVPTFICAVYFERVFLLALDTSGGFGDSILNGMLPVAMVWVGRYYLHFPDDHRTPGGKPLLIAVFLFFAAALILEVLVQTGKVSSIFDYCRELQAACLQIKE